MSDMSQEFGRSRIYEKASMDQGGGDEAKEFQAEDEAEALRYTRRESLSDELINGAETSKELFIGLRQLEKQLEESFIPPNLSERYTPPRQLSAMYERAEALAAPIEELIRNGWIKNYDPETGQADLKDRRFAAFALKTEIIEKTDNRGGYVGQDMKYFFGKADRVLRQGGKYVYMPGKEPVVTLPTSKERTDLEKAYRRAMMELAARHILGEHLGLRLGVQTRDSLENLVAILHSDRMPKFKADHLHTLFNLPSIDELDKNPENRVLGDKVEDAVFLNLVMLNSGNKERMLDFLNRPGSRYLIGKMAKEKGMEYEDWKEKYIGKVGEWKEDIDRRLEDKEKVPATWRKEADDGLRGELTKYSNIAAWAGGYTDKFSHEREVEFIEKTIGDLVGGGKEGVEASWIAASIMRAIGAYASEGYVALPDGTSHLPLGEARFISGDDTGKFWVYMFNMKEGLKGRKSGLKDMIGKIPDMAMNLFDYAGVEMKDLPESPNGRIRSIWDAWLGTPGGIPKTDLLTGERSKTEFTQEEPYHRLGDLNFKSLEREFHGSFTIMQWLMGNAEGPTGVFIEAMKTNFQFEKDFNLENLKAIWKYVSIVMNPIILTKGSSHLYTNPSEDAKVVAKNYFRNLMSARIRSASFAMGILNSTTKLFNPNVNLSGASHVEVPTAILASMIIEEALKDSPEDEERLVKHYLDENSKLRKGGTPLDVEGVVNNMKFESKNVGRITGKKV